MYLNVVAHMSVPQKKKLTCQNRKRQLRPSFFFSIKKLGSSYLTSDPGEKTEFAIVFTGVVKKKIDFTRGSTVVASFPKEFRAT